MLPKYFSGKKKPLVDGSIGISMATNGDLMGSKVRFWAVSGSTSWPGLAWVTFAQEKVMRAGQEQTALSLRLVLCVYTDIPGDFCTLFGLMLKCRDVGQRPGWQWWQIGGAAAGACGAGGAGKAPAEPRSGRKVCCGMQELWSISCSALVFQELCVCCGRDRVDF